MCCQQGISHTATMDLGRLTLRYCAFVFCAHQAANFVFRFLAAQVRDAERMTKAIAKERAPQPLSCQLLKSP
jgi:hypothetical protein